jgi:parallel beta-helix repeat protein
VTTRGIMELPRKWVVPVVAVVLALVLVLTAVAYLVFLDEEDGVPKSPVISIYGPDLPSSKLVDRGSGTAEDPYFITGLDVDVVAVPSAHPRYGIFVGNVNAHLIISGMTIRLVEGDPIVGYNDVVGIGVLDSENVSILDCKFENLVVGIRLVRSEHINVSVNTFSECEFGVVLGDGTMPHTNDTTIWSNTFRETDDCIYAEPQERTPSTGKGTGESGIVVDDNDFFDCITAARMYDASDVTIVRNSAQVMTSQVFVLVWTMHASIANNTIRSLGDAIALNGAVDTAVTSNDVAAVGSGIIASLSTNLNISKNTIKGGVWGFHEFGSNGGVWIEGCTGVNITYNRVLYNMVGVALVSSEGGNTTAMVHHNQFADNEIQAIDNAGSANLWDDGVGEGNYWSDYSSPDADSDGVGDQPYVIDSDSQDRYPLIDVHSAFAQEE